MINGGVVKWGAYFLPLCGGGKWLPPSELLFVPGKKRDHHTSSQPFYILLCMFFYELFFSFPPTVPDPPPGQKENDLIWNHTRGVCHVTRVIS